MAEEIWNARRSSFLPEADPGCEDEEVDITFTIHLGMTTAVAEFRAEQIPYRDGYERPGEDGVYVDKEYFKTLGLPESLQPEFDIDAAVKKVKDQFPVCHLDECSFGYLIFEGFRLSDIDRKSRYEAPPIRIRASANTACSHRSQRLNSITSQRLGERSSSMYPRTNHRRRSNRVQISRRLTLLPLSTVCQREARTVFAVRIMYAWG